MEKPQIHYAADGVLIICKDVEPASGETLECAVQDLVEKLQYSDIILKMTCTFLTIILICIILAYAGRQPPPRLHEGKMSGSDFQLLRHEIEYRRKAFAGDRQPDLLRKEFYTRNRVGGLPPEEYQKPASSIVHFYPISEVNNLCGSKWVGACAWSSTTEPVIIMADPCEAVHSYGDYAPVYISVLCHEMGHINGWSHK